MLPRWHWGMAQPDSLKIISLGAQSPGHTVVNSTVVLVPRGNGEASLSGSTVTYYCTGGKALVTVTRHASRITYCSTHTIPFQRQGKLRAVSAVDSLSHRVCGWSQFLLNLDSATQDVHSPIIVFGKPLESDTERDARVTTSRTHAPSTRLQVEFRAHSFLRESHRPSTI